MKLINFHCKANIGDLYATPARSFPWMNNADKIDLGLSEAEFERVRPALKGSAVIIGGGGLFGHSSGFDQAIESILASEAAAVVAWGAGHNRHGATTITPAPYLERFDLVGIRDYDVGYDWVPCASCMQQDFDKPYKVSRELVVYEHKDHPLEIASVPTMTNAGQELGPVLEFLGSAEVVLTNAYHGAYWSLLLGKKVIMIEPFSSRFYGLKHSVPKASRQNWENYLTETVAYPDALEECRAANLAFAEKVKAKVGAHQFVS